jgi:hypothetical protein
MATAKNSVLVIQASGIGITFPEVISAIQAEGYTVTTQTDYSSIPTDISVYAQVWDLSFVTPLDSAAITAFKSYVTAGGFLYAMTENPSFAQTRNDSVAQLIIDLGGGPTTIGPGFAGNASDWVNETYITPSLAKKVTFAAIAEITNPQGIPLIKDSSGRVQAMVWIGGCPGGFDAAVKGTLINIPDLNWLNGANLTVDNLTVITDLLKGVVKGTVDGTINCLGSSGVAPPWAGPTTAAPTTAAPTTAAPTTPPPPKIITWTFKTSQLPGTYYWTNDGPDATTDGADFVDDQNSGSFTVSSATPYNTGTFTRSIKGDNATEGPEYIHMRVRRDSVSGRILTIMNKILVNDTSTATTAPTTPATTAAPAIPVLPPGVSASNAAWGGAGVGGTANYRGGYSACSSHNGNGGGGGASPLGGNGGNWTANVDTEGTHGTGGSGGGITTAGVAGTGTLPGYGAVNATGYGNGGGGVETDGANGSLSNTRGGRGSGGIVKIDIAKGTYTFTAADVTASNATRINAGGLEWDNAAGLKTSDSVYNGALIGSFTVPAGVTKINVYLIAGGGGGGIGPCVNAGGGGGGAAYYQNYVVAPGTTYQIKVGAGGQGGLQSTDRGSAAGPPYGVSEAPWRGGKTAFCSSSGVELIYATGGNTRTDTCAAVTNADSASSDTADAPGTNLPVPPL